MKRSIQRFADTLSVLLGRLSDESSGAEALTKGWHACEQAEAALRERVAAAPALAGTLRGELERCRRLKALVRKGVAEQLIVTRDRLDVVRSAARNLPGPVLHAQTGLSCDLRG